MTNLDKVLDKIKKILKLSKNNPSEEEALTAAKMARTLLAKYSLSMADVDVDADHPSDDIVTRFANNNKRVKRWESYLSSIIDEFVPVRSVICEHWNKSKSIQFIGEEADVIVAVEMYTYLRATIMRMARQHYKVKILIKSYAMGAVTRLKERFIEMKEEAKREEGNVEEKYELMTLDKLVKVDGFIDSQLNTRQTTKRKLKISDLAYSHGYAEANQISLGHQLKGG